MGANQILLCIILVIIVAVIHSLAPVLKKIRSKAKYKKNISNEYKTTCPNCNKELRLKKDNIYFVCPYCKCKYIPTWRELGIGKEELNPKIRIIMENPNRMLSWDNFCDLLPPIENGIVLNNEIKNTDYKGGLLYNLEWLRNQEKNLSEKRNCPAPRPFENVAMLARKTKNYELEIAVCRRVKELVKIHDRIASERGVNGEIKFSQTSALKVIERLPRALELFKKSKNNKIQIINTKNKVNRNIQLEKQCTALSIPIEYISVDWFSKEKLYSVNDIEKYKRPEDAVMSIMRKDGWRGTSYELHPLKLAMKAACLEYIEEKSESIFMEDFIARDFASQIFLYKLEKQIALELARRKSINEIIKTCEFLLMCEESIAQFPLLRIEDIHVILLGIGMERFYKLMEVIFDNPQDNANGWPDIFAFNGEKMLLVEIKTSDLILDSQIYTWKNIIHEISNNSKIICVNKNVV